MIPSLSAPRRLAPLLLAVAVVVVFAVLLSLIGGRVVFAQDDGGDDGGEYGGDSGGEFTALDPDDPQYDPAIYDDNDLLGNCCVPDSQFYYNEYEDRVQCLTHVGLYKQNGDEITSDAERLAQCRALGGLHYDLKNATACGIRCGDYTDIVYCDPNENLEEQTPAYTCVDDKTKLSGDYDNDEAYAKSVGIYLNIDSCSAECRPPVDVKASVNCVCSIDGQNTCTVQAYQDAGDDPDAPSYDVIIDSLKVTLDWVMGGEPMGWLEAGDGGGIKDEEAEWMCEGNDGSAISCFDDAGQRISSEYVTIEPYENAYDDDEEYVTELVYADEQNPITIPAGGWFEAKIAVKAVKWDYSDVDPGDIVEEEGGVISAAVHAPGDPNHSNNKFDHDVQTKAQCKSFTVQSQCELGDESESGKPELYNWYSLGLTEYAEDDELGITLTLDSCLDSRYYGAPDWYELPEGCEWVFQDIEEGGQMYCEFSPDEVPVPSSIDFWVYVWPYDPAIDEDACRTGAPITVTATIEDSTGAANAARVVEVTEPKSACGECSICEEAGVVWDDDEGDYVPDPQACAALRGNGEGVPYCVWGVSKVKNPNGTGVIGQGACIPNIRNRECPVYYGYCYKTGEREAYIGDWTYYYAGRIDGTYVGTGETEAENQENFEWGQEYFTQDAGLDAEELTKVDFITRWSEEPGDSEYNQLQEYCEYETYEEEDDEDSEGRERAALEDEEEEDEEPGESFYGSNILSEDDYVAMTPYTPLIPTAYAGYRELLEEDLADCDNYDPSDTDMSLETGNVYFAEFYNQDNSERDGKYSCPATQALLQDIVTCCGAIECAEAVPLSKCRGQMVYTVGPDSLLDCEKDRASGWCDFSRLSEEEQQQIFPGI